MKTAAPTRLDPGGDGPLSPAEAKTIYDAMTTWYYDEGDGMLLTNRTKEMYLEAKKRLGRFAHEGATLADDERDEAGGRRMRELSLLRAQIKLDLSIYGLHFEPLDEEDEAFLRAAGVAPWRWPPRWRKLLRRPTGMTHDVRGEPTATGPRVHA